MTLPTVRGLRQRPGALRGLLLALTGLTLAACGSDGATGPDGGTPSTPDSSNDTVPEVGEILLGDSSTRFNEIDWTVVGVDRRPDGPDDSGVDSDPSEDFIYADLNATSSVNSVTFSVPFEWLNLVDTDGNGFRATDAIERGSGNSLSRYIEVAQSRDVELTLVFPVDSEDSFDGAWFEWAPQGFLPAAMAGPNAIDEAQRLEADFVATVYDGPFSRDEARVEVVEAYWSREFGTDADGNLIGSVSRGARRPATGHGVLLMHVEVTCRLTGISTGGCNVGSGQVVVDDKRYSGSHLNGAAGYDVTSPFWVSYTVPFEADRVMVDFNGQAPFEIADLAPLRSLETTTP